MTDRQDVILRINGRDFGGWKGVSVSRSIDQIAGGFNLRVTELNPDDRARWLIKRGDACKVLINGSTVITGHVDSAPISYTSDSHDLSVSGRDVTADLVDCSIEGPPTEWHNTGLARIAADICKPFGITISAETDLGAAFAKAKINEGDTAFQFIEGLCRKRAVLPVSYGDGVLRFVRTGANRAADRLELGVNILKGSRSGDNRDRFSRYAVKGQGKGSDKLTTADFVGPSAAATDPGIKRYRPLVLIASGPIDAGYCQKRANWEATTRAGKSMRMEYTVVGWLQSNGQPWPLNSLVTVRDKFLGAEGKTMLISAIENTLDESGRLTRLTCVPPGAYELMVEPEVGKGDKGDWLNGVPEGPTAP